MTGKQRKVKIGLVGCGKVALEHHLPSLKRLPAAEVVAIADSDADRRNDLARRFAVAGRYETADQLLADPDIEAVGVLTPTAGHFEIGMAALRAGKHVFIEKPLALTVAECDQLAQAGRESPRISMVCFNLRWHRSIVEARKILASGRLGTVIAVRSVYTHNRDGSDAPDWHRLLARGGGVTFNEGVHHIDLWRYLLGQEISEVFAVNTPSPVYEDAVSVLTARLSGGVLATAINAFTTGPASELEIFGSRGRLLVNLYRFDGVRFFASNEYPGQIAVRLREISGALMRVPAALSSPVRRGLFGETFHRAWQGFLDSITEGTTPLCTFEDGRRAVLATLAAVRSLQTGDAVVVREDGQDATSRP
jgi:predicted dehydrogenase